MSAERVIVPVQLDGELFRDFAVFDTLGRQGKWRLPALFCLILCVSAAICWALRDAERGGTLLSAVLLTVGVGLPLVYFLTFFRSISRQIDKMGLKTPKLVYTVTLSAEGVKVDNDSEHISHSWQELYRAYRVPGAVYLYPTAQRAYLLPDLEERPERVWRTVEAHLPPEKRFIKDK